MQSWCDTQFRDWTRRPPGVTVTVYSRNLLSHPEKFDDQMGVTSWVEQSQKLLSIVNLSKSAKTNSRKNRKGDIFFSFHLSKKWGCDLNHEGVPFPFEKVPGGIFSFWKDALEAVGHSSSQSFVIDDRVIWKSREVYPLNSMKELCWWTLVISFNWSACQSQGLLLYFEWNDGWTLSFECQYNGWEENQQCLIAQRLFPLMI